MATLMQNLERSTESVGDPIVRNYAIRLLQGMDDIPMEVLGVGKMRQTLPQIRHRVHQGAIALVASRGAVKDQQGTTMMISLENFNRLFLSLIQRSAEMQVERTSPSEMLMGLHSIPTLANFEINSQLMSHGHRDEELTELAF